MIYTCYEMIRDCRADKAEGWSHFASAYVPVIRKILAHYAPSGPDVLEPVLLAARKPGAELFQLLEPSPERWFVAQLRQQVVAALPVTAAQIPLDLDTVVEALAPLTFTEKLAAWFETMNYGTPEIGTLLRMAPATVEKIRERANELIRGKSDMWRRGLLAENGRTLGNQAAGIVKTEDCSTPKFFLDVLDGRATWRNREVMEHHATACWQCIDHFCRMAEVIELLRGVKPLTDAEAEPYHRLLGVKAKKRGWF